MASKFFCNSCKKYYSNEDAKKIRTNPDKIYSNVWIFCPDCGQPLIFVCESCSQGLMQIPKHPTTGDYNLNGYIDRFCSICGHSFPEYQIYSKRKLKKTVDMIFSRNGLPYNKKKEFLKELFKCKTESSAMKLINDRLCNSDGFKRL